VGASGAVTAPPHISLHHTASDRINPHMKCISVQSGQDLVREERSKGRAALDRAGMTGLVSEAGCLTTIPFPTGRSVAPSHANTLVWP